MQYNSHHTRKQISILGWNYEVGHVSTCLELFTCPSQRNVRDIGHRLHICEPLAAMMAQPTHNPRRIIQSLGLLPGAVSPQQGPVPTTKGGKAVVMNRAIIINSSHLPRFISRRSAMALQQAFVIAQLHRRRNMQLGWRRTWSLI